MIIETKEIYKCEFCRKLYQRKHFAEKHEAICHKNPATHRICYDCTHLTTRGVDDDSEDYGYDYDSGSRNVNVFFCNKLNIGVFPAKVEIKENALILSDFENEPMKKECKFYEDFERFSDFFNEKLKTI